MAIFDLIVLLDSKFGTYMFSAGITVLGVQRLVTGAAVRPALPHDVTLAAQRSLTLKTTEVLHVPVSSFCLRTFICQNNLGLRHNGESQRRSCGSKSENKSRLQQCE